jgi:dihydrodipicolinate synthase/N-acetylneuraminate lyase
MIMSKPLRGIFPVLQTPLDAGGELDPASLGREVRFCIEAGAHGLVYPVLGSEFQYLSDRERQQMVEVVVGEAAGQVPVVVGVAGPSAAVAVEHARHAARIGATAVIALPPYISAGSPDEILAYYQAIGQAADRPVFVQNTAPGMAPPFLLRLLREVEQVRYIKEEMSPSAHHVGAVVQAAGAACDGVFGGAFGRWMLSELRRGAGGFMPAAEVTDVYVRVWDAYEAGDEPAARQIFNRLLPLINLLMLLGLPVSKAVLVRRGVFRAALMRATGALALDADDQRELDAILDDLRPYFRTEGA